MDVGDNVGVDDVKLLVLEALDGREGLVQEVADCLLLGWINLEIQHAFAPRNSIKNVGEENVEAEQHVSSGNIRNVELLPAVDHAHVLCRPTQESIRGKKHTNNVRRLTQEFKKWFLVCTGDRLQDRARQRVAACWGLPHNILDTKLDKACKIGIVEIEYWLIELGGWAENPTQDFLQLCVGDCLRKQVNQGSAYFSAMLIQSPICWGHRIRGT